MNMPIKSRLWRKCAEMQPLWFKRVCTWNPTRYGRGTGLLSGRPLEQHKRGIKCTRAQFWRQSSQFSDYPHVTARWSTSVRSIAQRSALALALLVPCWWTVIRSRALLLAALLVASLALLPAKTNSFGSKLPLAWADACAKPLLSFISPLLSPLRLCVWGSFSCLPFSARECPAHSENSRSIKGVAHV